MPRRSSGSQRLQFAARELSQCKCRYFNFEGLLSRNESLNQKIESLVLLACRGRCYGQNSASADENCASFSIGRVVGPTHFRGFWPLLGNVSVGQFFSSALLEPRTALRAKLH